MTSQVRVHPTKRFVVETLCRDISLEDAVLDLIDNSIDSFIRHALIVPSADLLFHESMIPHDERRAVNVRIGEKEFVIEDTCGGIDKRSAKEDVFRFGKVIDEDEGVEHRGTLSVYGVGLKRAIFKLGRKITVESRTIEEGFSVDIDTDEWLKDDDKHDPKWTFPLEDLPAAKNASRAGTKITVKRLNDDTKMRFADGTFLTRLRARIAVTYSLLLNRYVVVSVNDSVIEPEEIPIGLSEEIQPAVDTVRLDRVNVQIVAGLCARPWKGEKAGWYVLCNGRVVVEADKSDLTGWGLKVAGYQPKYRGFLGVVFLFSQFPEDLPWTTTKRGLNRESGIYQQMLSKMQLQSRPVMSFLDRMYVSTEVESQYERELAADVRQGKFAEIVKDVRTFSVPADPSRREKKVSVQFKIERQKLELIKRSLKKPGWSAGQIGRHAIDYLIKKECAE